MRVVECAGDSVEVVFEQVRVGIEGHGRGRVPEHSLHGFHIRARTDGEGGGGMAQVVRCHTREHRILRLRPSDRAREPAGLRARQAEVVVTAAEEQIAGVLVVDRAIEERREELRVGTERAR